MSWADNGYLQMTEKSSAFDAFIDDCFLDEDPICNKVRSDSLDLIGSKLISELVSNKDDEQIAV